MKAKLILPILPARLGAPSAPTKDSDKEAFERSVAEALPNEQWLAKAVADMFYADIHAHSGGSSASKFGKPGEHVWHYGSVLVRYTIKPDAKRVEVLSITRNDKQAA